MNNNLLVLPCNSRTLRSTLHVWLDAFPEDFRDPPDYPLLNQFLTFCEQHAKDSEIHFKVKHRMERLIKHPEPGKRKRDNNSLFPSTFPFISCVLYLKFLSDQSPSMQRILATNADLAYSSHGELNGGSAVNGICLNGSLSGNDQGGETSLHTIFLELPEKHMAEQLTKLDTVCSYQMTHSLHT